ncbi:MAG TPA: DUF6065 family protein [Thermomicrobiales bacterium]|jgi:hypothetical protein
MCRIEFHAPAHLFDRVPHPYPASRSVPEWLKAMPMDRGGGGTVKRCPPFVEAMTAGYIVPVPFDITLSVNDQGMLSVDAPPNVVNAHYPVQYEGSPFANQVVLKFSNPWVIVTPPGYVCLIVPPINRFESPVVPFTGIVETDSYYKEINFPSVCNLRRGASVTLAAGSPLAQVIPFRREAWTSAVVPMDAAKRTAEEEPFTTNRHAYKEGIWKKLEYA